MELIKKPIIKNWYIIKVNCGNNHKTYIKIGEGKESRPEDLASKYSKLAANTSTVLVLEELEHAINRGAKIYAEVVGYGASSDAYHITSPAPSGEGGARAMINAIKDANISSDDLTYINAHGTSTHLNDLYETQQ